MNGQLRAADRAGIGLGVIPPAFDVVVFAGAGRAHGERGHRGRGPVVGHVADDGISWPAIGAVDERIPVAPVGGIQQFLATIRADRQVRRHQGIDHVAGDALADEERLEGFRLGDIGRLDGGDDGRRGWLPLDRFQKLPVPVARSLGVNEHAGGVVQHPAVNVVVAGKAVDEGPETDTLHHATNPVEPRDHDPVRG